MKNRCVRKRNHHSRLSIGFFLSRRDITVSGAVSIKYGLRTTDYGLRTGCKMWTKHYGLGIKYGLRYKTRTEHYGLSIKHEERF